MPTCITTKQTGFVTGGGGLNWPEGAFLQRTGRWGQKGPLPLSPNLSVTRLALDSGSRSRSWSSSYSKSLQILVPGLSGAGPPSPLASSSAFLPLLSQRTFLSRGEGPSQQPHHGNHRLHQADGRAVRNNKLADSHKSFFQIPAWMFNSPGRDFAVG